VSVAVNVDTIIFLATVTYRDIAISKLHYIVINADHLFTPLKTCVTSHSGLVYYGMSVLLTGYDHVTSGYSLFTPLKTFLLFEGRNHILTTVILHHFTHIYNHNIGSIKYKNALSIIYLSWDNKLMG